MRVYGNEDHSVTQQVLGARFLQVSDSRIFSIILIDCFYFYILFVSLGRILIILKGSNRGFLLIQCRPVHGTPRIRTSQIDKQT